MALGLQLLFRIIDTCFLCWPADLFLLVSMAAIRMCGARRIKWPVVERLAKGSNSFVPEDSFLVNQNYKTREVGALTDVEMEAKVFYFGAEE